MLPDPSPIFRPVPVTPRAAGPVNGLPIEVRMIGLAIGATVAALFVLVVHGYDVITAGDPAAPILTTPILVAGALAGWLVAPMAWTNHRRRDWAASILSMAIGAVAIGDVVLVVTLLLSDPPTVNGVVSWDPGQLAAGVVEIFLLGLVFYGWLALPFTLAASVIWSAGFCRIRGWLAREGRS